MFRRLFKKDPQLEEGVKKTRASFFGRIAVVLGRTQISEETWNEVEELLIGADVGVAATEALLDRLRLRFARGEFRTGEDLNVGLQDELVELLRPPKGQLPGLPGPGLNEGLAVVLVIGVNGVGKTTTIAKLGNYWRGQGRRVILAAGDTFRAAGSAQLEVWADRLGLPCIGSQSGADPGSIVFDAISAAKARGLDTVIVDTAGRLHTKTNLMEELRKIRRIVERHEIPSHSLLVLDATTGQNAILQARAFADAAGLDGIVVTKLDGTARGGMVFSIVPELNAPVWFVGTGEQVDDLSEFDPEAFVGALFDSGNGESRDV
ncbi:MAG: signal recognition particle-docking protein FtsY [Chloroflexi bacterium]|nr:signal recognition particle-docking protein FtsY [Chloroflexota bacterium]